MKQSKILGALLPTIPEYKPIIQQLRDKYNLPEISPDDEIFLWKIFMKEYSLW